MDLYPACLRVVLTWIVPVGVMTTVPAQALTGVASPATLAGAVGVSVVLVLAAIAFFRFGLRRYTGASS
ncbi:MAG: hypothetical protein AVDCRST_MAG77-5125 [uncultured Chloroflexi bacterium]|uniref:Uncharacterized protein n=1 Tax=uncultured Chloroflexota bacterium TaxID=166587 RepID=A0A6J4K505_9CHLR|nr:MAG: hypothetical protein AVDCRST_MAG77-5125 [uncultured Chloroflexota bacterium]